MQATAAAKSAKQFSCCFFVIFALNLEIGMNYEDILVRAPHPKCENWQLGNLLSEEVPENGIVLLFCSEERGGGGDHEMKDFSALRKELYDLSKLDFELPICDMGTIISGRSLSDTHYLIEELVTLCLLKNAVPIIIGGSNDLAFPLFSALNARHAQLTYTQISNLISLSTDGEGITAENFLSGILTSKNFSIKNYHHLGYQKHLNPVDSVKLMREVDFDVIRLAEMMGSTERTEPFFRLADLVTVDCDAVESVGDGFSANPQVNGLNRREICAYMKEIGLSQNLKAAGIFNYNISARNPMNHQLMAQMIWHLIEGIMIQHSHPKERSYETFWIFDGEDKYAFHRETFSDLWYFGAHDDENKYIACAAADYEAAKKGIINTRLLRNS